MTYSIAWALFALGLLVLWHRQKIPAARYAAMALLCVTLLKLFFHDLAQLAQLYRIGAFIGVAIIAMLASFAYQNFIPQRQSRRRTKMKPNRNFPAILVCGLALAGAFAANAAMLPLTGSMCRILNVASPGLVKISLPVETLDAARPGLEDLRLCDDAGNEAALPDFASRAVAKAVQSAKSFQVSLNAADRHHARNRDWRSRWMA
jgi:hypothetical protein